MQPKGVERARQRLAARLPDPTQILRGSLLKLELHHKRGCPKCARGQGHRVWVLKVSYAGGRTRQFSIRPEQRAQVARWLRIYQELKRRLEAICELNQALLRPEE